MHLIDQQLNLMIRGRFEEGWKIAEELHQQMPDDLRARFNRGWFLLYKGDLQAGFKLLESGRHLNVYGSQKPNTTKPVWDQTDLTGKTVIINLEAGIGDQIIYARFATEIWRRGGKAILCCEKPMHSMFSRVPGVQKCITLDEFSTTQHDFWIPSFSCSWLFGHTFDTLPREPYLFASHDSVKVWQNFMNTSKKKIGIRWSGNPKFEHQQFRIFPSELLINLYKDNDHLQFYSLQRDNDVRELPEEIIDLQHLLISWEDTLAAIENMDLIITSCTSIAHAAAAMGKPTWVVVPILPYHVWAYGGEHSPWYEETTRVFRQTKFGQWEDTFQRVAEELQLKFPKTNSKNMEAELVDSTGIVVSSDVKLTDLH
jgi:hypothetical protein